MQAPTPTEIRVSKDKKQLSIQFETGEAFTLPAELLRVESPSAEVQGHDPSQKKVIPSKRNVQIMTIEPIGNYAIRITFDDMHDTGIFSWNVLFKLGNNAEDLMQSYVSALAEKGLSR